MHGGQALSISSILLTKNLAWGGGATLGPIQLAQDHPQLMDVDKCLVAPFFHQLHSVGHCIFRYCNQHVDSVEFEPQPNHNVGGGAGLVDSLLKAEVPESSMQAIKVSSCLMPQSH